MVEAKNAAAEEQRLRKEVPAPKHGDPTEAAPPGQGESVIGVRTGSEASVDSGTDPVLPLTGIGSEFTKVKNKDLVERDKKEFRKRGHRGDGSRPASVSISMSFEGLMVIERKEVEGEKEGATQIVSGSFSGQVPEGGLKIRALTEKELEEHLEVTGQSVPASAGSTGLRGGTSTATQRKP